MLSNQIAPSGKFLCRFLVTLLMCSLLAGCPENKKKKDNPPDDQATQNVNDSAEPPGNTNTNTDTNSNTDTDTERGVTGFEHCVGALRDDAGTTVTLRQAQRTCFFLLACREVPLCSVMFGDPHLVTFDDLRYDFHAVGEFELFSMYGEPEITIQVRTQPMDALNELPFKNCSRGVSVNTAMATILGGHRVSIDPNREAPLLVDGSPVEVPEEGITYPDGSTLLAAEDGSNYVFFWPDETSALVEITTGEQSFLAITVSPNPGRATEIVGLFGLPNDDQSDDFRRRDGSIIAQPLSFETLYRDFAENWRINEADSLFDYPPGKGYADFQDSAAPRVIAGIDDLPAEAVSLARAQCEDAGVTGGQLNACTLDTVCDPDGSFIESARNRPEGTGDSSLALPTSIFFLPTPDALNAISIDNLHAHVSHGAVQAINIADPSNAQLLTASGPVGGTNNMHAAGEFVYATGGGTGLQVFDFSNPDAPVLLGSVNTPGDSVGIDVTVEGDYAYISYVNNADPDGGLAIVDISQPEAPTIAGQISITHITNNGGALAVNGRYAFVQSLQDSPGTLHVIDISDPATPNAVGSVVAGGVGSHIANSGKHVYIVRLVSDDLSVVDVSNPASPVEVGSVSWRWPESASGNARDLVLAGNKAFITEDLFYIDPDTGPGFISGLQAVDISDPENPARGKRMETGGAETTQQVDIFGSFAYVTTDGGLWIVGLGNFAD